MKPCLNINATEIFVGKAATVHYPLTVLMFKLQWNIVTGTFLLVSCSNKFGLRMHDITKTFVRLHDH